VICTSLGGMFSFDYFVPCCRPIWDQIDAALSALWALGPADVQTREARLG